MRVEESRGEERRGEERRGEERRVEQSRVEQSRVEQNKVVQSKVEQRREERIQVFMPFYVRLSALTIHKISIITLTLYTYLFLFIFLFSPSHRVLTGHAFVIFNKCITILTFQISSLQFAFLFINLPIISYYLEFFSFNIILLID